MEQRNEFSQKKLFTIFKNIILQFFSIKLKNKAKESLCENERKMSNNEQELQR